MRWSRLHLCSSETLDRSRFAKFMSSKRGLRTTAGSLRLEIGAFRAL
jgi:hypothetical protein